MHYPLLIDFDNKPLLSSGFAAYHQEDSSRPYQQPVNIMHDYTNCCLYIVDPPDDEQQACSKHVEAHYCNKLIEVSASFWFI